MPPKKKSSKPATSTTGIEGNFDKTKKSQDGRHVAIENNNDELVCKVCENVFVDEGDKLIECERCGEWECFDCSNLMVTEYQVLTSSKAKIHWYCASCNEAAVKAVQTDKLIEEKCKEYFVTVRKEMAEIKDELDSKISGVDTRLEDVNKKLKQEIKDLRDQLSEQSSGFDQKIDDKLSNSAQKSIEEMSWREERKLNIVIFNVVESVSTDVEERKEHDKNILMGIQEAMGTTVALTNAVRIGKQRTGEDDVEDAKPRPLRVKASNIQGHRQILNSAKSLSTSENFKNVYISRDMTPLEQTQWKALVEERKMRQAESDQKGDKTRWMIRNKKVIRGRDKPKEGEEGEGAMR